jgi:hypothetical protein
MKEEMNIANAINNALGLDIFDKKKTQDVVDARSIFCYILHKQLNYTLYSIRDIFKENGKSFDHASVLYSANMYLEVSKRKPSLEQIRLEVLGQTHPKLILMNRIENIHDADRLKGILNLLNFQER